MNWLPDDLLSFGEYDGVVGGGVHLGGDDAAHEVDGVVADAVDLRAAPQRVGVLHAVAEPVAL